MRLESYAIHGDMKQCGKCGGWSDPLQRHECPAPASPPKPEGQEWPFTDPKAMESIERGIVDAKAGRIYGTGEGMREAGGVHDLICRAVIALAKEGRGSEDPVVRALVKADHLYHHPEQAAPAPQGLREALQRIRDEVAANDPTDALATLDNAIAALGEASEPVSPKGEPSNPSPSSPEIPDISPEPHTRKGEG